ncbi:hypothetical protein BJ742DRAFT_106110 [Cladochytrium replicatum]|nr:hypothetical protein BJ742DRAFT_106110 [Cladochytrium replicatum]
MSAATMDGPARLARGPGNFTHQRSKSTPHTMMYPFNDGIYGEGQLPSAAAAAYAGYAAALSRSGVAPEDALFRAALFAGGQQQHLTHQYPNHFAAAPGTDHLKNLPPSALSAQFELLARAAAMSPYGYDPAAAANHARMAYSPYNPEMAVVGAAPSLPHIPPTYAPYNPASKQFYYPSANGPANNPVMAAALAAAAARQYGLASPDALHSHHTHSRKRTQSTDGTANMGASLVTPVTSPLKLHPFQDDQSSDSTTGGHSHDEMDPALFGANTPSSRAGPDRESKKLNLYKTELCRSWEETGYCRYGGKCQFAHSETELRPVDRHPKYKTEMCKTFWEKGTCPYGKRCCFIHTDRDVEKKMADIERRLIAIQDEKDENGHVIPGSLPDHAPQRSQSVSAGPSDESAAAATVQTGIMPGGHVRSKSLGAPRETMLRPQLEALAAFNSKPKSFAGSEQQLGSNSPGLIVAPTPTSLMMGMLSPTHHHVHHPFSSPSRAPVGSRPSIHEGMFATPASGPQSASVLELGMMLKNVQISPSPVGSTASSGSTAVQLASPTRVPDASESLWEEAVPSLSSSLPAEDSATSVFLEEGRRMQHRRIKSVGSGRAVGASARYGHKQHASVKIEQGYAPSETTTTGAGVAAAAAENSEEVDGRLAFFKNIA